MQTFFSAVRPVFNGRMSQSQVDGIKQIHGKCLDENIDRQGTAYCLATSFHETGRQMQPVREGFATSDHSAVRIVTRMFERGRINTNYAKADPVTGKNYFGRGHVQLTWKKNYQRAGEKLGLDFVNFPELVLEPNISVEILVVGMKEGWFTGVNLDDVSEPLTSDPDFTNDRKIVNGRDRAKEIARVAEVFYKALESVM